MPLNDPTLNKIKLHIEQQMNYKSIIPDGARGAFILYSDTSDPGVQTAIATKIGNHWTITEDLGYHPHGDGLKAGINIMATW